MYKSRKRQEISIEQKLEIIKYVEDIESKGGTLIYKLISQKFNIKSTTLTNLLKKENRDKIKDMIFKQGLSTSTRRIKKTKYALTSKALLTWFSSMRHGKPELSISGVMLILKATEFARKLNEIGQTDEVDINWINRWKSHYEITCKKMCGESLSVNTADISSWKEKCLSEILSQYSPENILNCDEFGLFWRLTPDKTLAFKHEDVHGGKKSKERFTVLATVSMSGEKYPLTVIGKYGKPRCFKNVNNIPVSYKFNRSAWMTSVIFREYLMNLDYLMSRQNRYVCLILDCCPSHTIPETLKNIKIFFYHRVLLPKQLLDAGIIRSTKSFYRIYLIKKMLVSHEANIIFSMNLLDSLHLLKKSWDSVLNRTIINCFRHTGFIQNEILESQIVEIYEDKPNCFNDLKKFININITFSDYLSCDDSIETTKELSTEDIVNLISKPNDSEENSDGQIDDSEQIICPSKKEILLSIQTVQNYLNFNKEIGNKYSNVISNLMSEIEDEIISSRQQTKLDCYFDIK